MWWRFWGLFHFLSVVFCCLRIYICDRYYYEIFQKHGSSRNHHHLNFIFLFDNRKYWIAYIASIFCVPARRFHMYVIFVFFVYSSFILSFVCRPNMILLLREKKILSFISVSWLYEFIYEKVGEEAQTNKYVECLGIGIVCVIWSLLHGYYGFQNWNEIYYLDIILLNKYMMTWRIIMSRYFQIFWFEFLTNQFIANFNWIF